MKDITHSLCRFTLIGAALAAALAASGGAQADILGSIPTQEGGEFLLVSSGCGSEKNGWLVVATDDGGRVSHKGCTYPVNDGRAMIEWSDGNLSVIPNQWHLTKAGKRVKAEQARDLLAPHAEPAVFTVEELEADMRRRGLPTVEEIEGGVRRLTDRILVEQAAARRTP